MDATVAGHDAAVVKAVRLAEMIRDHASSFGNHQYACAGIPGTDPELPVPVVSTARDPGQIEGRAAEPPDSLHPGEHMAEILGVSLSVEVAVVRKTSGDHGVLEDSLLGDIDRSGLDFRTLPLLGDELLMSGHILDDTHCGLPVNPEGD